MFRKLFALALVFLLTALQGESQSGVITNPEANSSIVIGTNIDVDISLYGPPPGSWTWRDEELWISANSSNWRQLVNFNPINGNEWSDIPPNHYFWLMHKERWSDNYGRVFVYEDFVGGPYTAVLDTPAISSLSNNGSWTITEPVTASWTTVGSYRIAYFQIIGVRSDNTEVEISGQIDPGLRTYTWNLPECASDVENIYVKCTWDANNPYVSTSPVVAVDISQPGPITISGSVFSIGHMGLHLEIPNVYIYQNGVFVAESDNSGSYSFEVPWNWSGTVTAGMSFYSFLPLSIPLENVRSNTSGIDFQRNWVGPTYDAVSFVPTGNGRSYWAICPAGDMYGHPNITFSYDFADATMPTELPTGSLRLRIWPFDPNDDIIEVYNDAPVTAANGYVANFYTPHPALVSDIIDCGRMMLYGQLQVYEAVAGPFGDPAWVQTTTPPVFPFSGFSKLDLVTNNAIDLSDLSAFNTSYGKCQGQVGYNFCANFVPTETDNCVDTSDLTLFATHFGHRAPGKRTELVPVDTDCALEIDPRDDGAFRIRLITSSDGWRAFAAYLYIPQLDLEQSITWNPVENSGFVTGFARNTAVNGANCVLVGTADDTNTNSNVVLGEIVISSDREPKVNSSVIRVQSIETTTEEFESSPTPMKEQIVREGIHISQAHNNPINGEFMMRIERPQGSSASVRVYDIRGRLIQELAVVDLGGNFSETAWDGRDSRGAKVPGGVYFVNAVSGPYRATEKVLILR